MRLSKLIIPALAVAVLTIPALAGAQTLDEVGAYSSEGFGGGIFTRAICDLYELVGGSFGAMLTSAALFTGLIAAAAGGFQSVRGAIMVGVGSFGMSAGVSLYFGTFGC